jgi:hypothetical protein
MPERECGSFWRRADAASVQALGSSELWDLVPSWFDERFKQERETGIVLGIEDTGDLIHTLLVLGAGNGPDARAARLPVRGAPGLNDAMLGMLTVDQVRTATAYLSRVPIEDWVQRYRDRLAGTAREFGYSRPFNDEWATKLVRDTRELVALFERAAARGEAIVVAISA